MKNKYFINIISGYFKSLYGFSLVENYHLHTFIGAKEAGYTEFVAIVDGGIDLLQQDPNLKSLQEKYGINLIILDKKNNLNLLKLILKYALKKSTFYTNGHNLTMYLSIIFSKIFSFGLAKNIFMAHTQAVRGGLGKAKLKQFFQDKVLFRFFVDRVRLNNLTEKKFLLTRGVAERKLFVVPLVVDEHIFTKVKDYKERHDLLYFGSLSQKKNVPTILQTLKYILDTRQEYKNLKLNIIGREADYFLEEDVNKLDLRNNIVKYGFLPLADLNSTMNNFLIYLNDSKDEGQCVAVYEASLAGCALCLPKIMSFVDVFKGVALFHEVGDYQKLAENILYYLEHPQLIKEHNEKAIHMIKTDYSEKNIEAKMHQLFSF